MEKLAYFLLSISSCLQWPNFTTFSSIMFSPFTHILINHHPRSPFQYPPPLRPGILSGSDGGKLVTSLLGVIQHEPNLCNASLLAWTVDIVPGAYRRRSTSHGVITKGRQKSTAGSLSVVHRGEDDRFSSPVLCCVTVCGYSEA